MFEETYIQFVFMSRVCFISFMARKTHEEAQETRRRILATAIRHCEQRGYERLALADVAQEAGVTRGAIYHHFANKQALFLEMVEVLLGRMGAAILDAAEKAPDTWQSLVAGCRTFLAASRDKTYQSIILNQALAVLGTERWNALDQTYTTQSLIEVLSDLEAEGVIDVPDIQAAAEALSGAMNQLSRWVAAGHRLETAWDTLALLLQALLVHSGQPSGTVEGTMDSVE
jgi:AcrR family transcriptional regulator